MLFPRARRIEFKLEAFYPVESYWRDITSLLSDARINLGDVSSIGTGALGGDGVVRIASFSLSNNRPVEGSLAPRNQGSEWNHNPVTNAYEPLLRPSRRVRLFITEVEPWGTAIADPVDDHGLTDEDDAGLLIRDGAGVETLVFDGFLGDEIRSDEHVFRVTALDHAKPLMRKFIEDEYSSIAGVAPSVAMQGLIDAVMPVNHRPQIVVEGSETFVMPAWEPRDTTVWAALQDVAGQMGWLLSFELGSGTPVLTLREPPRGSTVADYSLAGSDIYVNQLVSSDSDVRNEIAVDYVDRTVNPPVSARVLVDDPVSIVELTDGVPVRAVLGGDATALISNPSDAQALATNVLNDLSDIYEVVSAVTPIFPGLKLYDILGLATELLSGFSEFSLMSEDESYSVESEDGTRSITGVRADNVPYSVSSIQHRVSVSKSGASLETSFIATGRVIGRRTWWLEKELK